MLPLVLGFSERRGIASPSAAERRLMRGIGSVLGKGGEKDRLAMKPATAQEGIALLRTAELRLHTVQLCIDQLTVLEACAALRTLAVRLQELSLRA
jgi:hypothetical protein